MIQPKLREEMDGQIDAIADRLVQIILAQNLGYRSTELVPVADLQRSCRDNIERVLQFLWADDREPATFGAAEATGRERAEQGLPLDDVLRSFRLGGRLIWEVLIEQAQRPQIRLEPEDLRELGTRLWEGVDVSSAHVASAYHHVERSLALADEQRSTALWEELLAGRGSEPGFAVTAAHLLGLPVQADLLVVVLTRSVESLGEQLSAHGIASAWHQRTDSVVGILDVTVGGSTMALDVLRAAGGVSGGVSRVVSRFTQVVEGFEQARLALRTLPDGVAEVVCFDDRLTEELLLSQPDIAARLVEVWLAPLGALPGAESRDLLWTLRAWAECGGSMSHTAERAHCHRNTALNRITRIEAILGRRLVGSPVPLELLLALRANTL